MIDGVVFLAARLLRSRKTHLLVTLVSRLTNPCIRLSLSDVWRREGLVPLDWYLTKVPKWKLARPERLELPATRFVGRIGELLGLAGRATERLAVRFGMHAPRLRSRAGSQVSVRQIGALPTRDGVAERARLTQNLEVRWSVEIRRRQQPIVRG